MSRWKEYNPNPVGSKTIDCVIRAIVMATGESWEHVYMQLTVEGYKRGTWGCVNHVWGALLRRMGFKRAFVQDDCESCYTVEDFAQEHPHGTYVLAVSGHVVCVKDGYYYDSWDSGNEIPIYYWCKEDSE